MTINEFAHNLDVASTDKLVDTLAELRLDENLGAVLESGDESEVWQQW